MISGHARRDADDLAPSRLVADLRFALEGERLPADYAQPLAAAVSAALPWFAAEALAGIHPLRGAVLGGGGFGISRRARLALRLPLARIEAANALRGRRLTLGEETLGVGAATLRPVNACGTLFARLVLLGPDEEGEFAQAVEGLLAAMGIACDLVLGRVGVLATEQGPQRGFGVLLHGLDAAQSLRLQEEGIGSHRLCGCGMLVPYKSVGAVV